MQTFNQRFWAASREDGEWGDLARLILANSRARVLSDFDRLREFVARNESADTLAALDRLYAEHQNEK